MPAASYDSQYLLAMFNRKAGRPAADAVSDASKYQRLSESQNRVIAELSSVAPRSLYPKVAYSALPTLTTTDNQVYTFGSDANLYPIFPMGKGGIFRSLSDIPNNPLVENVEFISEGNQVRALNNGTLPSTLYWYGVAQPADIDATNQPSISPEAARELIVIDAVRQFAVEYARQPDLAAAMAAEWSSAWPKWCMVWKSQYKSGGVILAQRSGNSGGSSSSTVVIAGNTGYFNTEYWG